VIQDQRGKMVCPMPYLKTALLALARLNLSDRIERRGITIDDPECRDAIRLVAIMMCAISNAPAGDADQIMQKMIAEAKAAAAAKNEDPLTFFKTFSLTIELPPVEKVDLKNIVDSLRAQAEVGRAL